MMKKLYKLLVGGIVLATLMVSCTQELANPEVDITSVRCSISPINIEEDFATGALDTLKDTKATFSGASFLWSVGDKIGIVPNTGAQIYFAVNEGAGTSTAAFDGGDWAMKSTGTFYAYYPLYPDIFLTKDHVSVSYAGQVQDGNNNNLHAGDFWTLYTGGTTAVGNTLNFSFNHLTSFFKTYVTVPAGTYTKITFSAPSEVFIKEGYFDLSAQTPTIVGTTMTDELSLDLQNVTFADETELTGFLVLAPVDITGIPITVTVYKDGAATYEYTLTKASPMVAAKTYAFRATSLTQIASSPAQANALFAAGATAITITEPLTDDATVVLPNTDEAVTLTLPTTASSSKLTVSYGPSASAYPATLAITGPEGADLNIQTPNSTVTLNGTSYDQVTSRTAANTCIIPAGIIVNLLKVIQGGVQVYGTVSQIDLSEQEDNAIINVSGTVASLLGEDDEEYSPVTGVTLNHSSINLNVGDTETLTATVTPVGAYPKVIWTSSDETVTTVSPVGVVTAVAEGSATITARTVSGGFTASCEVTTTISQPDYVDLGLSVKWATCNLGASSPEEFGDFYAWGELETKSDYSFSTYKFELGTGLEGPFSKYVTTPSFGSVDSKAVLDPEDDVAQTKLGDNWRMPTKTEWKELLDNCTWVKTNNYNGTGIKGQIVTSKKPGYTEKSIFLPNAGFWYEARFLSGQYGNYWSSSLDTDSQGFAWCLFCDSVGTLTHTGRMAGFSVRPVYGASIPVLSVSLNKSSLELFSGDMELLTSIVSPSNATTKDVYWQTSDEAVATVTDGRVTAIGVGTATITAYASNGVRASCLVTVKNRGPEAIDLGLPSGTKWASFNIGASAPEEYGDYFAWGEADPYYISQSPIIWKDGKTGYDWASYKWCNGSDESFTKYVTVLNGQYGTYDGKSVLDPEDDTAHMKLGGGWRMPTDAECIELVNNCVWTWVTDYNGSGVNGRLVTASNGNSIFLPAAGCRLGSDLCEVGLVGYYWSSSLHFNFPSDGQFVDFTSSKVTTLSVYRHYGFQVRPVFEE